MWPATVSDRVCLSVLSPGGARLRLTGSLNLLMLRVNLGPYGCFILPNGAIAVDKEFMFA